MKSINQRPNECERERGHSRFIGNCASKILTISRTEKSRHGLSWKMNFFVFVLFSRRESDDWPYSFELIPRDAVIETDHYFLVASFRFLY